MHTLPSILTLGAARDFHAPAVTDDAGTLDWAAFTARVAGAAAQLRRAGAGPGAPVALWLPNSADYLAMIFAVARLGALAIHVNTRYRAAEVGMLLQCSRAAVLVTEWGFAPVDFPSVLTSVPAEDRASLRQVIGRHLHGGATSIAGVPVQPLDPQGDAPDTATPEAPCLTFTTSGTTSGPKLVLHVQRSAPGTRSR